MKIEKEFDEDTLGIKTWMKDGVFYGWEINAFLGVEFSCKIPFPECNIRDAFKSLMNLRNLEQEWALGVVKLSDVTIEFLLFDDWRLYDNLTEMGVISNDGSEFCYPKKINHFNFTYENGYEIANAIRKRKSDVSQQVVDSRESVNGRYRDVDKYGNTIWRSYDDPIEYTDDESTEEINATQDGADTHDH